MTQIKESGVNIVGVSNDSTEVLAKFGAAGGIQFPLLSDPDSKVIRQFGVLNDSMKKGSKKFGIAHPVTVIVGSDGMVAGKIISENHVRHSTTALVEKWNKVKPVEEATMVSVPPALNFEVKNIKGEDVKMSNYAGKVVVVVNTASRCGYTRQYETLQKLYAEHKDAGLEILGFPCNQFGGQEPGTETEIQEFCKENYGVEFPMFSKVEVNGDKRAPLFKYLTTQETQPKKAGDVKWNFEKFVLDRSGKVVARFGSGVEPDGKEFKELIAGLLKAEK